MTGRAEPVGEPGWREWTWLGLLTAVFLSSALCVYCIDGLVDPIKRSLRITDVQMSLVLGWAYIGPFAVCSLPAGWLSDRASRRLMLALGATLWGVGTATCALASSYLVLCLGRALVGVGHAALAPAAISILADIFPSRLRARTFGVIMAALGIGPGVGLTVSGAMLSLAEGLSATPWRVAVLLCAAPVLLAPPALLLMREPGRAAVAIEAGGAAERQDWRPLLMTLAAVGAVTLSDGAQLSWSAAALVREHAISPAEAARLVGYVFIFCGAAAPLIAGALGDVFHKRYGAPGRLLVAIVAVAALVPLQCFYSTGSAAQLLTLLLGTGFTVVTGEVVGAAVLQDLAPAGRRGLAAAANSLCGLSAIAVGTTSVALVARQREGAVHAVTEAMSLVTAPSSAVALLLLLGLWLMVRRSHRARPVELLAA